MERDVEHLIDRLHDSVVGTEDPNIAGPDDVSITPEPGETAEPAESEESGDEVGGVAEARRVPPPGS